MALTSSIYDHFIIWPSSVTLIFNLHEQMFRTALDNNCAKLFWNPCINIQVMVRTTSIYHHLDFKLTPMTLTFNLPKKMFQMALLLLEGNNCAQLFWNPYIIVQVMARTSSISDHFDLYLTPVTFTFNLREKIFKWHFSSSRTTTVQNYFEIRDHCTSYGPDKLNIRPFWPLFDPCDLDFNLPEKMFQMALSPSRATTVQNYFKIHA